MLDTVSHKFRTLADNDISDDELSMAVSVMNNNKVALFIVAYNAECFLESVIKRIPSSIIKLFIEIFIIDDCSTDHTYSVALSISSRLSNINLNIYRTPFNRGYGGNQKLGYLYCIKNKYDIVVLLHGDGQYAPEYLPRVIAAHNSRPDAVFASRMLNKRRALKGGMPIHKWIGNQVLTNIQNSIMGTNLTEYHTGFRSYRVESLKNIPFIYNTDDFHFDTEIIIQASTSEWTILETEIPTHYGAEKCHVNGIKYAYNCVESILKYHLVQFGKGAGDVFKERLLQT